MGEEQHMNKMFFISEMKRTISFFGDIDEQTINIYYDIMKTWTEKELEISVNNVIKTYDRNYFPKPATFIKARPKRERLL